MKILFHLLTRIYFHTLQSLWRHANFSTSFLNEFWQSQFFPSSEYLFDFLFLLPPLRCLLVCTYHVLYVPCEFFTIYAFILETWMKTRFYVCMSVNWPVNANYCKHAQSKFSGNSLWVSFTLRVSCFLGLTPSGPILKDYCRLILPNLLCYLPGSCRLCYARPSRNNELFPTY